MRRAFEILLRLYPKSHRELLGEEMSAVFEEAAREYRVQGWRAYTRFAVAEWIGLVLGAARARRRDQRRHPAIDLRKMRAPEVSRQTYAAAVDEVLEAERRVAFNLRLMQEAIADHEFVEAGHYSDEDRKAREHLRLVRKKYRIAG